MIPRESLSRLPLFEGTAPGVISALASHGIEVRYAPGSVLFLTGGTPRGWYIVLEGLVRVVRGAGERQHVVHTEGPGGTLGEVPLVLGETHPATGIAGEPTRCAIFDRPSLEAAIAECPEIAFLITRRLALRVRGLVARLDERSAKSVRGRLIEFLLDRAAAATGESVSVGMTQQKLAEELGTVREVVSRELRRLANEQLIASLGGGRFRVLDSAGLRSAGEGGGE
jgi:CRP/FNR family transcriptional regulator